jgi:hypothetical protein
LFDSTGPFDCPRATVRRISRNVKRWQCGDMWLRWTPVARAKRKRVISHGDEVAASPV